MAGRILEFPRPATLPAGGGTQGLSLNSRPSTREAPPSKCEADMRSTAARAAGLGCVRGTTLALTLEAGAAAVIYAAWLLMRLLH